MSSELRSREEAEDIVQCTLQEVDRDLACFEDRDPKTFRAWVLQVAENTIRDRVDHFRAKKRQGEPRPVPLLPSPSTGAAGAELAHRLREAIGRLPPEFRQVIGMRRFQGLSCREIAEILRKSEGAVRTLYSRAVRALKDEFRTS